MEKNWAEENQYSEENKGKKRRKNVNIAKKKRREH